MNTLNAKEVFTTKDWKEVERQRCEVYTRVMWYYRPVSHFNEWKKAEHFWRKHFEENTCANSDFIKQYS